MSGRNINITFKVFKLFSKLNVFCVVSKRRGVELYYIIRLRIYIDKLNMVQNEHNNSGDVFFFLLGSH